MIADIPHSPDILYQDAGYSDSYPTISKRNNYPKINLTNRNNKSTIKRSNRQRLRRTYDDIKSGDNEEFGLDVFLKIKVSIFFI